MDKITNLEGIKMFRFLNKLDNILTHINFTNNVVNNEISIVKPTQKAIIRNIKYLKSLLNQVEF